MALLETPRFNPPVYREFDIPNPCAKGINLQDLEFEQDADQSPYTINMMYRNGAFGKRYGQDVYSTYQDEIYTTTNFQGNLIIHAGDKIYRNEVVINSGLPRKKGVFFYFNRMLFFICDGYYVLDEEAYTFNRVVPYIPDIVINRKPDGSTSDTVEDYNRVGTGFKNTFHGDGTSTQYVLTDQNLDNRQPIVEVDNKVLTTDQYSVDYQQGIITFNSPVGKGINNVVITAYKTEQKYIDTIINCKYWSAFGGTNNSRLFLAGSGNSIYYYSEVFDGTYFPESNYARVGNTTEDITGFGEQYDTLMVFKPREIHAIEYYLDQDGVGQFTSKVVNAKMGCDVPDSIQLINNQLTWLSKTDGVCTLVSTNIRDERNIRPISRNINGGFRVDGLLNELFLENAQSVDWNGKYILSVNGNAYVWDYNISPYTNSGKIETDAKRLAWYIFDNFTATNYIKDGDKLLYSTGNKLVELNDSFNDFDKPIHAIYQTPLLQFGYEEYLKNIRNVYVQVRGDTASRIEMKYITEDNPTGEIENEPIIVYSRLWNDFKWNTFGWAKVNFANMFRRKCSLKKVQMAGIIFENNELNSDMSISHLSFQYNVVKNVK